MLLCGDDGGDIEKTEARRITGGESDAVLQAGYDKSKAMIDTSKEPGYIR